MDPSLAYENRKRVEAIPRNPYAKRIESGSVNGQNSRLSAAAEAVPRRRTLKDANNNQVNSREQHCNHQQSSQRSSTTTRQGRPSAISPISALELLRHSRSRRKSPLHLLTQDIPWTRLDAGRIHELAGAAGTAKTQLALQICVQCATMGYECSYASVKHVKNLSLLAHRLNQMIAPTTQSAHKVLSRIHLKGIRNADELADLQIDTAQRLLVLDSVADVFRGDTDYTQRALQFCQWIQTWRRDYSHCVILILNQVTLNETQPALGMTWAHCVNASFLVRRLGNDRILSLQRSPIFGPHQVKFSIQTSGCQLLN